jgi:hypothetical protein
VLAGTHSDINIVAPSSEAQDRKPGILRGGVAIKGGLAANTVLNIASLSLFMMHRWLLA